LEGDRITIRIVLLVDRKSVDFFLSPIIDDGVRCDFKKPGLEFVFLPVGVQGRIGFDEHLLCDV